MQGLTAAASGLRDANIRLGAASHNIANLNVEEPVLNDVTSLSAPNGGGVHTFLHTRESTLGGVDLVSEGVNVILARNSFQANTRTIRALDESMGTIIDILDSNNQ